MKRAMAFIVALGLVLAASPPGGARAEIREADLRVNGLSCPFCAFGIEKKLREVDGVQQVEVLLDEGRIHLALSSDNNATVGALDRAVEKAGFELAGLRLQVRGRLVEGGDVTLLETGSGARYRLVERTGGRLDPISARTRERIRNAGAGGHALVSGEVHSRGDEVPVLSVEDVSEAVAAGG